MVNPALFHPKGEYHHNAKQSVSTRQRATGHTVRQRRPGSVHMLKAWTAAAEPTADDGSDSNEHERHAAPSGGTHASEARSSEKTSE